MESHFRFSPYTNNKYGEEMKLVDQLPPGIRQVIYDYGPDIEMSIYLDFWSNKLRTASVYRAEAVNASKRKMSY